MKFKSLLCTIALGALAFAACEKPEPAPQPEPEPEVIEPTLDTPEATAEGNTITITGKAENFVYIDNEKTPTGVWTSLDQGKQKTETAGTFDAEKKIITGTVTDLEYAKTYTVGTYVSVDGKKTYSKGIEVTLEAPATTPVVFSELKASLDRQNVTISAKTADFTYVDGEKTAVGIWYTAEGSTEKTKLTGSYDAETSTITGTAENMAYGVYTFGVYANEDGTEQYSEGKEVRLVEPPVFSEVTAEAIEKKISATGKVSGFTFVDMETTAVGLWYKPADGERKEAKSEAAPAEGQITAITKDLPAGTYTVGIWVRKDLVKFYSEGVTVTIEAIPGFHTPGFNDGIEF